MSVFKAIISSDNIYFQYFPNNPFIVLYYRFYPQENDEIVISLSHGRLRVHIIIFLWISDTSEEENRKSKANEDRT